MERLKDFDLPWYTKDDLIDLLEEYPNLFEMTESQLRELAHELYSSAEGFNSKAAGLENEAGAIEKYCNAKYGKGEKNNE